MSKFLHAKKFICKILIGWLPYKQRILYREALYWFSLRDYLRFKYTKNQIVSLGSNCLPRGLTTAINLKPRRFYGEKTCPFDLCVNKDLKKITHLIENDFNDFFYNIIVNKENFPHDYKLSHKNFVSRYQKRIDNFLKIMQSDKILYFIHSNYDKVPKREDILNLYKVIETKRDGKPFKFILLTYKYIEDLPEVIQIPYNITIDDSAWLVYIINEYRDYDNKYTEFKDIMKRKLQQVICDF